MLQRNPFIGYNNVNSDILDQDSLLAYFPNQSLEMKPIAIPMESVIPYSTMAPESPTIMHMRLKDPHHYMRHRKYNFQERIDPRREIDENPNPRRSSRIGKESMDWKADKDGFKRPREIKCEGGAPEFQELIYRREPVGFISSYINPERAIPFIPVDDEEYRRVYGQMNANLIPMADFMVSQNPMIYSPEGIRYFQPRESVSPHDHCRMLHNDREDEYFGMIDVPSEGMHPNYFCSPPLNPELVSNSNPVEQPAKRTKVKVKVKKEPHATTLKKTSVKEVKSAPIVITEKVKQVGSLSLSERKKKIDRYLKKRQKRIWEKKIAYDCRKKVADKRLRIKGRFVTQQQALTLLGTTAKDLMNNKQFKTLMEKKNNCSIVTLAGNMKIRNIQKLFNTSSNKEAPQPEKSSVENQGVKEGAKNSMAEEVKGGDNKELNVVVLSEDLKEHIVEIRIENLNKEGKQEPGETLSKVDNDKLPKIANSIFKFEKIASNEYHPEHTKYHRNEK